MTRKKSHPALLPRRVLTGQLVLEECPNIEPTAFRGIPIMIGLHPDNSRYAVYASALDKTITIVSEGRPVLRACLSAVVEAMVTARPKPRKRSAP
jgi:hypothetical protein